MLHDPMGVQCVMRLSHGLADCTLQHEASRDGSGLHQQQTVICAPLALILLFAWLSLTLHVHDRRLERFVPFICYKCQQSAKREKN